MILFYSRKYLSKNHKININIYKYLMKFFSFKNQFQEPQAEMFLRIEGFQVSFFGNLESTLFDKGNDKDGV